MYKDGLSASYDRALNLFPEDVTAWVQESQPEAWKALDKGHGMNALDRLLERLRQELDTRGTLDVLRNGVELFPVKSKIAMAQFAPASGVNPNLRGRDIARAFDTEEFHILLVANKFQTGFDQPLLCGMYVDKRLGGIQAVQTLSRLNRAYSGKCGERDTTYVLDFRNEADEVLAAFKEYYEIALLEDVTDPNLVYNLRSKLDAAGHYDDFEVERVAEAELNPASKQSDLVRALEPVADRLLKQFKAAQERWKAAKQNGDDTAAKEAHDEMETLLLFRQDSRKSFEPAIELFEGREHLGSLSKSKVELTRPSTTFRDRSDPFLQQLQMENG